MPRSKFDPLFKAKRIEKFIKQKAIEYDLRQDDVCKKLKMSYPTYLKRKRTGEWTFNDLVLMFDVLHFTDEEKIKVFS